MIVERCRQLIVAAARVNLVKLVLDIPLNTHTKEKRPTFQKLNNAQNTRKEIPLSCSSKRESELSSFRFDYNNITVKVEDHVVQRYHLLEKDISAVGETLGRTFQNRIPSATPKNR
jgi:hypothetical protein